MTLPKFPFPRTAKKLKSSSPTFRFRDPCLAGGGACCWGRGRRGCCCVTGNGTEPGRSIGRPCGPGGPAEAGGIGRDCWVPSTGTLEGCCRRMGKRIETMTRVILPGIHQDQGHKDRLKDLEAFRRGFPFGLVRLAPEESLEAPELLLPEGVLE